MNSSVNIIEIHKSVMAIIKMILFLLTSVLLMGCGKEPNVRINLINDRGHPIKPPEVTIQAVKERLVIEVVEEKTKKVLRRKELSIISNPSNIQPDNDPWVNESGLDDILKGVNKGFDVFVSRRRSNKILYVEVLSPQYDKYLIETYANKVMSLLSENYKWIDTIKLVFIIGKRNTTKLIWTKQHLYNEEKTRVIINRHGFRNRVMVHSEYLDIKGKS